MNAARARAATFILTALLVSLAIPASATIPCVAVPVLDDRCESWAVVHDFAPAGVAWSNETIADTVLVGENLVVGGWIRDKGATVDDQLLASFGPGGSLRWQTRIDGPERGIDRFNAVAASPDGSTIFAAGVTNHVAPNFYTNSDYSTAAFDAATGKRLWHRTYDGFDVDGPYGSNEVWDVAVAPDGSEVYVTGQSLGGATVWDYATFAFDAASGEELWRARHETPGDDIGRVVAAGTDRVYVSGSSGSVMTTIAYETGDPNRLGQVLWRVSSPAGHGATSIVLDEARETLFVASHGSVLFALDTSNGSERWRAAPQHSIASLALSPTDGRVALAGTRVTPQNVIVPRDMDMAVTVLDTATGLAVWSDTSALPGRTEEEANAVVFSSDGDEVYVGGYSSDVFFTYVPNWVTTAFDANTGSRLWHARYKSEGALLDRDEATHLAVAGDRLIVAGIINNFPDEEHREIATVDLGLVGYEL